MYKNGALSHDQTGDRLTLWCRT